MITELNHFGIVVSDLEASMTFYQKAFNATTVFEGFIPSTGTDVRYLQIAGGMIELLHRREQDPDEVKGITHIAFLTDDLDADHARLVDAGVHEFTAPKTAGSGVGRLSFVRDPNNARVELIERDVTMREGIVEDEFVVGFDHYSLRAPDLDGARNFYQNLFGMKNLTTMHIAATELTIDYLHWDYDVLELLHRPVPETEIYAHLALRVNDLDGIVAKLAGHGIEPLPGTPKPAGNGHGSLAKITDPDGVKIELLERADLRDL